VSGLSYPVLVTYTHRHVVWVEADSRDAAVGYLNEAPYEVTSDHETLYEAGWSVAAPKDRYDWDDVQDGGYSYPYQGTQADAHVEAWRTEQYRVKREAEKAACAAAGHPGVTTDPFGQYCPVCWRLDAEVTS